MPTWRDEADLDMPLTEFLRPEISGFPLFEITANGKLSVRSNNSNNEYTKKHNTQILSIAWANQSWNINYIIGMVSPIYANLEYVLHPGAPTRTNICLAKQGQDVSPGEQAVRHVS